MLRPLNTLHIILHLLICSKSSYVYCGLARLIWVFSKPQILCIIISHQKDIKLYVLDPFHLQRPKLSKVQTSQYTYIYNTVKIIQQSIS